jgi:hypothetical protein
MKLSKLFQRVAVLGAILIVFIGAVLVIGSSFGLVTPGLTVQSQIAAAAALQFATATAVTRLREQGKGFVLALKTLGLTALGMLAYSAVYLVLDLIGVRGLWSFILSYAASCVAMLLTTGAKLDEIEKTDSDPATAKPSSPAKSKRRK